jgi:uncharacterized integral membrane protein
MKKVKLVMGWLCILALVIFVVMNFQQTEVKILNARLTAPLSFIVLLAAVLGALGAPSFKRIFSWAKGDRY